MMVVNKNSPISAFVQIDFGRIIFGQHFNTKTVRWLQWIVEE